MTYPGPPLQGFKVEEVELDSHNPDEYDILGIM